MNPLKSFSIRLAVASLLIVGWGALPSGNYFARLSVAGSFAVTQLTILK